MPSEEAFARLALGIAPPSLEDLCVEVIAAPPPTADDLILRLHEKLRAAAPRQERSPQEPTAIGDEVECDLFLTVEGRLVPDSLRWSARLQVQPFPHLPGLMETLLEMGPGTAESFSLQLPRDYPAPELAGREAMGYLLLKRVFGVDMPELDDPVALRAAGLGEGLEEAMETVAAEIDAEQGQELLVEATQAVLETLAERLEDRPAPELVERELSEQWLRVAAPIFSPGSPFVEMADELRGHFLDCPRLREDVSRRIRIGRALGAIVEQEQLTPDVEVMENLLETASAAAGVTPEIAKAALRQRPEEAQTAGETALYLTAVQYVMARAKVEVIDLPEGVR